MAHLIVRLQGKIISEIALSEDRAYVAGRKEDCDIVLQPEKGISREHFKISFANGAWTLSVVSRYGEVIHNGENIQQIALSYGTHFSVPPYEFDFLAASQLPVEASQAGSLQSVSQMERGRPDDMSGNDEKTTVGISAMIAYIKVVDSSNEAREMIRLESGDSWTAGRDPSCQIQIRDQRVSRRQFEIRRSGSQYLIIDLGSVNGTLVNGSPISSTEPTPIRSGDSISVLENYLYFELHDSSFKSRLELVNVTPVSPLVPVSSEQQYSQNELMAYQQGNGMPMPYQQQYPAGMQPPPEAGSKKFDYQKHRPKLIGGAVALVLVAYLFSGGEKKDIPKAPTGASTAAEAFAKLKPEQQTLIRQRYKDAKNLYMQGKYQLSQDEVVKIQDLVPDYEDIKEIARLSKEAIFIQEEQRRTEANDKAKAEAEEKIQKQVVVCQAKINPDVTMEIIDQCLSDVLQFNPDHPKIADLHSQVAVLTAAREAKEADKAAYQAKVAKLKGIYASAQTVEKKATNPLEMIDAYEKVVASKLPDPHGLKDQSQRSIASIRQMMNQKTASYQQAADKFYQSQKLKEAILSLRKARQVDPNNPDLPEKIERYTGELRKAMMALYQEGILEESFGNVEGGESKVGAKDKWKKILDQDIPDGEYYKKAYIKLKKYGAM